MKASNRFPEALVRLMRAGEPGRYRVSLVLAALTCALAPLYTIRWHVGFYPTTLLEAGIVVTLVAFAVETVQGPRNLDWWSPFTLPAGLFLIAGAISVVAAPDPRSAVGLYRAYIVEPIAFFLVVATVARTLERALLIAAGLGLGGVILAIPNAAAVLAAVENHSLHAEAATPVAIYLTANAVALFLEPLIALAGSVLLYASDNRQRLPCLVFLLIAVPTELLTFSRGGFLALGAVIIGLALASSRRWWLLAAAVVGALAVSRIPSISARIAVEVDLHNPSNTLVGRFSLWSAALRMLRDHPLFGAGLSGFSKRLAPYWNATHSDRFVDPHNIVLNFWSETGLLGLVAFAWILVAGFRVAWEGWRQQTEWRPIHLGVLLALLAVLVHGLVDVPYFKNDLSLEFWALLGLAWAGRRSLAGRAQPAVARETAA